jgi:sec-independent protein translocase protein TatC
MLESGETSQNVAERDPNLYLKQLRKEQGYMPLGDHLEELRKRIFRTLFYLALFSLISVVFFPLIWQFVMGPILPLMEKSGENIPFVKIIVTRVTDFFFLQLKVVVLSAVVFAIPFLILELWNFLKPAFELSVKKKGWLIIISAIFLFWGGVSFARLIVWPQVIDYLIFAWVPPELSFGNSSLPAMKPEVHLTLDEYLSFFFAFHFAFGLSFELPAMSMLLAFLDIISVDSFKKSWRYALLFLAVFSAMVTPPDMFSMLALMLPMLLLFLLSGLIVWTIQRKNKTQERH